jgi:hypothetical protein
MPIRSNLAMALILTSAIACGFAIQAQAQSTGFIHLVKQDDDDDDDDDRGGEKKRDLRPEPDYDHKGRPRVHFAPNAKVVPVGNWINFRISSSVTGYGHIYVMSASGKAQVWMENVPIIGGRRLVFPVGSRLGIQAQPPAGREDLMLIVTRKRIKGFFGYETTRTPSTLEDYDHKSFKAALTAKFIKLPKHQWNFARTSVRVVDRSPTGPNWGWGKTDPYYWEGQFDD